MLCVEVWTACQQTLNQFRIAIFACNSNGICIKVFGSESGNHEFFNNMSILFSLFACKTWKMSQNSSTNWRKGQFTAITIQSSETISVERLPIKRHFQHWLHCPCHQWDDCWRYLDWCHSAATPMQYTRIHHVRQPSKPFPVQNRIAHSNQSDTIDVLRLNCLFAGQLDASLAVARLCNHCPIDRRCTAVFDWSYLIDLDRMHTRTPICPI